MNILSVSEKNRLRDKEIDKIVNDMFKRAHKIKRIRRKRKIKEWLKATLTKKSLMRYEKRRCKENIP